MYFFLPIFPFYTFLIFYNFLGLYWVQFWFRADCTQDAEEDEHQLARVKDWINSRHLDTVELTDVLSNFPDISVVRASIFPSCINSYLWIKYLSLATCFLSHTSFLGPKHNIRNLTMNSPWWRRKWMVSRLATKLPRQKIPYTWR